MKPLKAFLLLLAFTVTSFVHHRLEDEDKDKGSFFATVDGKVFQLREDQLFRGLLINKPGSMDGTTPARTVISVNFNGNSYDLNGGKIFSESVSVEIVYKGESLGAQENYALALQYASTNYYMLKEQMNLSINEFTWESDKKHFRLSAEFNCKMRSWGYPSDGKKDVTLKGRMNNIRITVPSWLVQKN